MLFPPKSRVNVPRRVVVTGAGIITAMGNGWAINSAGFKAGERFFRKVDLFDVSRQRVQVAAQAEIPPLPRLALGQRYLSRLERAARLLLHATHEAVQMSGWKGGPAPIVLATTSGGMSLGERFYRANFHGTEPGSKLPSHLVHYQAQQQGLGVAEAFQLSGPVTVISNACSAGGNAIGHAWSLIRNGTTDRALAGGFDALSNLVFAGFDSLQALSPTTCRPFDAQRDGLALGEGAAVFTLESLDKAVDRGAMIMGEIVGYGASTDLHHLTQPHPEGDAALLAMTKACAVAGLQPRDIGYINAHGTATVLNDQAEAHAINRWAGADAPQVNVSSTKASIGHLLGAAGAVEAAGCLMALREQWLPPTRTISTVDPIVRFNLVRESCAAPADFQYALSNSFGFGGSNSTLIFKRYP